MSVETTAASRLKRWRVKQDLKRLLVLAACALFALGGCKEDAADKPADDPAAAGAVETMAKRHVELTPDRVKNGRAAFGACMGCHGEKAEGRIGIGPRLASESFLAAAGDDFLLNNIRNGRAGTTMVAWKESYSEEQMKALVAYLRSLQPVPAAKLDESPLKGDVEEGAKLFRNICSGCHGRNGGGYQETANGTGIGRKVFLDKASDGFLRHVIHAGKTHTAMRGFAGDDPMAVANLTDQQIDNIIAYLRSNAW
jgi:mono/diheme cytochrome c family protein